MEVLTVKRVCDECGVKLPHEVKQILFANKNITEIEDLGLSLVLHFFLLGFPLWVAIFTQLKSDFKIKQCLFLQRAE